MSKPPFTPRPPHLWRRPTLTRPPFWITQHCFYAGKLITWSSWSTCGCAGARGFRQRTCLTNCRPQDTQQTEECTDCPTTTSTTTTATTTATRTTNQEIVTFHANPRIAKKSLDQEGTPGPSNGTTATVGGFEKDSQAVGSDRAVIIVTASVVVAVLLMVIVVLLCRVKRNHNIKTQAFPIHVQAEPAAETTWLPEVAVYHMTPRSPSRSCPNINRPLPDTPPQGRRPTKPPRRNRPSGQTLQHSLSADNVLLENTYAECGPSQTPLGTNSPTMSSSNQYLRPINWPHALGITRKQEPASGEDGRSTWEEAQPQGGNCVYRKIHNDWNLSETTHCSVFVARLNFLFSATVWVRLRWWVEKLYYLIILQWKTVCQ